MANEVEIVVKSTDKSAQGLNSAKKNVSELGDSTKRVGDIANGILAAGVFEQIGQSAARGLKQTYQAASDLEQAVGGTEAVFGDASGAIDEFASRSAEAAGLSEREFRDMSTLIGGQLKRMTGDVDFASEASIKLTEVGADLAATYGGTTKDAMDAFAAAMRGEADPAERFNLNLKTSVVNAKAVEMGLAASTDAVDENAKAQATMALIMEQSSDAQGQFAREADTAAVSQQKATAAMEDAKAEIGSALLPVMASLFGVVSDVATAFAALPGPIKSVVSVVGVLSAGLLVLAPRIVAAKAAMEAMGVTLPTVGPKMRAAGVAARRTAGALMALSVAGAAVGAAFGKEVNPNVEALDNRLGDFAESGKVSGEMARLLGGEVEKLGEELKRASEDGLGSWIGKTIELIPGLDSLEGSFGLSEERVKALDAALAQAVSGGNVDEAAAAFERLTRIAEEQGIPIERLKELFPQYAGAMEAANDKAREGAGAVGEHTGAMDKNASATDEAKKALQEYADAQKAAADPVFALLSAVQSADSAQRDYNQAVRQHGKDSKQAKDAAIDVAKAVSDVEGAALDGELSFDKFQDKLRDWVRQGVITAGQARNIEDRVRRARGEAQSFRGRYKATLSADTRQAMANTQALKDQIASLQDRTVFVHQQYVRHGVPITGLAHGGIHGAGSASEGPPSHAQEGGPRGNATLVGEQGPELVDLPPGTQVHSNPDTERMLSGSSSNQPIVIELRSSGSRLDDMLLEILRHAIKVRGGDAQVVLGRN